MSCTPTIWNSADKASGITLSGGDLTVTGNSSGFVRTVKGNSSGKWYWEVTISAMGSYSSPRIGVATIGANHDGGLGTIAGAPSWVFFGYDVTKSQKMTNSSNAYYGSGISVSDVIGVALDLDAGKIWWSINGAWCVSGDPAAGTGEAYSGISGTVHPAHQPYYPSSTCIANFGGSALTYSPPSGFNAGFGQITAVIAASTATLIIAPQSAIVKDLGKISASTAALIITPQSAIITAGYFKGKYVFSLFPYWAELQEDSFSHKNDAFTPVTGVSCVEEIELYTKYKAHFRYTFNTKYQIGFLNNIFDDHLGRLSSLWFPSFRNDFVLTADIGADDYTINVEDAEYDAFYSQVPGTGRYILIYINANTWFATKIVGAPTSTTLVINEPLGQTVSMSRTMISILYFGRFDIDEIEWKYITPDVATTDVYFIELPDEYEDLS